MTSPTTAWLSAFLFTQAVEVPVYLLGLNVDPATGNIRIEGESPAKEAVLYTRVGDDFRRVAVFEIEVAALREAEPAQKFVF